MGTVTICEKALSLPLQSSQRWESLKGTIRSIVKDKKSGKGCNGNCGSCGGHCH